MFVGCGSEDDDNGSLSVEFQSGSTVTEEGTSVLNIPLSISGSSSSETFVTYEISSESTADFPLDITPLTNTTFIIPPGASAFNIEFTVLEDQVTELESESLIIDLISISDGGVLGSQTRHAIEISEDNVSVVSFETTSTSTTFGNDFTTNILLSRAYEEDLEIEIDLDVIDDFDGDFYYFVPTNFSSLFGTTLDNEFVTIPAGQTSAPLSFTFNRFFVSSSFTGGEVAIFEIIDANDESGFTPQDVIVDGELADVEHRVNVTENSSGSDPGTLLLSISWTSTNNDVDLDIYLFDSESNQILTSTAIGLDGEESVEITNESDDVYSLVLDWVSGTVTADVALTITPMDGATWEGSTNSETINYNDVSAAQLEEVNVIIDITKSGDDFTGQIFD